MIQVGMDWIRSAATFLFFWVVLIGSSMAKEPAVSFKLTGVTAEKGEDGDLLVVCRVLLDNRTGEEIVTKTRFGSAFDGLTITVTDTEGKVLAVQGYTYHQSPFGPDLREVIVKLGRTDASLAFPMAKGHYGKKIGVQLTGLLTDGAEPILLHSERKEVVVKAQ